jgi:uncharacterized membrane protein YqjE
MLLMNHDIPNGKNLTTLLSEMKEELQEFAQTRIAMLRTELREKLQTLKTAAPLGAAAILLLTTAYFLFTFALVGLIAAALADNRYRWFIAFLGIAVLWTLLGGLAAYLAKRELEVKGLMPKRTIEVLKGDKMWVQSEVKNQI